MFFILALLNRPMKIAIPFLFSLASVFLFCIPQSLSASHAAGAELQYQCIGPNQYKIILKFYRDCKGISAPANPSVQLTAPGCAGSTALTITLFPDTSLLCASGWNGGACEVSPSVCPAYVSQTGCNYTGSGVPPYPGIKMYVYTGTVTLPYTCSSWRVRFTESARNPSNNLLNSSGNNLSIQAIINNSIDTATAQPIQNNSVEFTSLPVFMACAGSPVWYNHGAHDADGDSLVFSLVTPLGNGFNPLTFAAGWTVNQPIRTNPAGSLVFTSTTGQLSFTPSSVEVDVLAVQVNEYRNGVLVGTTVRDMQISVLNCISYLPEIGNFENVTGCEQVDSNTVNICYGATASFEIKASDPGYSSLILSSDIQNNPYLSSNVTVTQIDTADSVTFKVQWASNAFQKGCHTFLLSATNDNCPVTGSLTKEFNLCIDTGLNAYGSMPVYCGSPVKLNISGGNNVSWAPSTGLSDSTSAAPWASPLVPTTYVVTSTCGTDSVFIDTAATQQVDAGPDTVTCSNIAVALNATYSNALIDKTIWSGSSMVADSLVGLQGYNTPSVVFTQSATSTVYFHAVYADGCNVYDSVNVIRKPVPNLVASATPSVSCSSSSNNMLVASLNPYCGVVSNSVCPSPSIITVGTGTLTIPAGTPTSYPTIYGNYKKSARHQFLYSAAELNTLAGSGGIITALSFNISQFNANATLKNFTIRIGCTNSQELVQWEPGVVEVFSPKDVTVTASGWMVHQLDQQYQWDGVSNLVIDVCFSNPTGAVMNSRMAATQTVNNTVLYSTDNLVPVCGQYFAQNKGKLRPNIRFSFCPSTPYAGQVLWNSQSGLSSFSNPSASVSSFTPQASDTFSVSLLDSLTGCVLYDTIVVPMSDVAVAPTVTAARCNNNNGAISLNATGSYTPLSVLWNTGSTNTSLSSLAPGFYSVQVTDATGCVERDSITVPDLPMFTMTLSAKNTTCQGTANGSAGVHVSGGFPPYNVVWSGGVGNTDTVYNLPVGTYLATVTDSVGCASSVTAIIQTGTPIVYTVSAGITLCNLSNGTTAVLFPNGNPGYTVVWYNGDTAFGLSHLASGYYSFTITDTAGCSVTDSMFVACVVSVPGVNANSLNIYPNPFKNTCTISLGDLAGKIEVQTELGQRIYSTRIEGKEHVITCKDWANGVYYVTVTDVTGNVVGRAKVVKE